MPSEAVNYMLVLNLSVNGNVILIVSVLPCLPEHR